MGQGAVWCLPSPSFILSQAMSWDGTGWDGAKLATGTTPEAQLCHSPSCSAWNGTTSSVSCAEATPGISFSSFPQVTLGTLVGLCSMSVTGWMDGYLQKRCLGIALS